MKIKVLLNIFLCQFGIRSVLPASVIMDINVVENNEPVVDVSGIKTSKITANVFTVRMTVMEMLKRADNLLPNGYNLVLIEGYRNLAEQKKKWQKRIENLQTQHLKLSLAEIEKMAVKFSAKPGSSGHGTGGAVNVSVCDNNGNLIDMGSKYSEASPRSYTKAKGLTALQKKNREMLASAMKSAEFVNYPAEWWHWSYGDKMWAAYSGKKFAVYGRI